jgi:hypothetical protein
MKVRNKSSYVLTSGASERPSTRPQAQWLGKADVLRPTGKLE